MSDRLRTLSLLAISFSVTLVILLVVAYVFASPAGPSPMFGDRNVAPVQPIGPGDLEP